MKVGYYLLSTRGYVFFCSNRRGDPARRLEQAADLMIQNVLPVLWRMDARILGGSWEVPEGALLIYESEACVQFCTIRSVEKQPNKYWVV